MHYLHILFVELTFFNEQTLFTLSKPTNKGVFGVCEQKTTKTGKSFYGGGEKST